MDTDASLTVAISTPTAQNLFEIMRLRECVIQEAVEWSLGCGVERARLDASRAAYRAECAARGEDPDAVDLSCPPF